MARSPASRILSIAFGLLLPLSLQATSFYERPFPENVQDAPVIVRGKIGNSYSDWAKNEPTRRIYTFYEMQVEETFKGNVPQKNILIREIGGEKDGVGMEVSGAAKFDRGEDVVVFLTEKNPDNSYDVQGMMTGKYGIRKDESGKEYLVGSGIHAPHAGHSDHEQSPDGTGQDDTRRPQKWTLEALRQLVDTQAKEPKDQPLPTVTPSVSATVQPTATQTPSPAAEAPQLQSNNVTGEPETEPQNDGPDIMLVLLAALAVAVVAGLFFLMWKGKGGKP